MAVPVRFTVDGLYGEFNHRIDFPAAHEFAIIYGPNGVGKTRLFEIVNALSAISVLDLLLLQFRAASIKYDDGTIISVDVVRDKDNVETWRFELSRPGTLTPAVWDFGSPEATQNVRRGRIYAGGSQWRYSGQGLWMDEDDGETISSRELEGRYGVETLLEDMPTVFQEFRATVETHLIETQRLINRTAEPRLGTARYRPVSGHTVSTRVAPGARYVPGRRPGDPDSTVSRYSADLRSRMATALAENSRTTQALDRTFPRRILSVSTVGEAEDDELIRSRYSTQNRKRERLAELSLIGPESDLPLPDRTLEPWERGVLHTYLDDTEQKLKTFDDLLAKVNLLEEIINKRFLRKQIRVNAEDGLSIVMTRGGDRIPPESLSSGEQHELIMFYDLLFRVSPGALVMIDEPEISLHVAWQREFLDDIMRVAHVSSARMLVATHSPQIIGKWRSRTTRLGFGDGDYQTDFDTE